MDLLERIRQEPDVDAEKIAEALARAPASPDAASVLWAARVVPERVLVKALSAQSGFPGVDLSRCIVLLKNLELLPDDWRRAKRVLPILVREDSIVLALANPKDEKLAQELSFFTGLRVLRHVAIAAALKAAVEACEAAVAQGEPFWKGRDVRATTSSPQGRAEVVHPAGATPEQQVAEGDTPVVQGLVLEPTSYADLRRHIDEHGVPVLMGEALPSRSNAEAPAVATSGVPTVRAELGVGKVLLIADDDPDMRELLKKLVAPLHCAVVETGDGKEALKLARELRPAAVILDGLMPGMHGFEVCRAIKGDPLLSRTSVLLVSGEVVGRKVSHDVGEAHGADGFFEKPFRPDHLVEAVKRCLMMGAEQERWAQNRRVAALETCKQAAVMAKAGRTDEAIALLRAASAKDPYSAEPHFYLGQLLRASKDPYAAVAAFERAVDLRPDLDQPLAQLGELYAQLGFRESAKESFTNALAATRDEALKARVEAGLRALDG